MKKLLYLAFAVVFGFTVLSCSDDRDTPINNYEQLPTAAQSFIKEHFSEQRSVRVERDGNNYEVYLSDGTKVEFSENGQWTEVDAPFGKSIPTGFIPTPIMDFIAQTYPGQSINEISRDSRGYDVELINGIDLEFAPDGTFIRVDN